MNAPTGEGRGPESIPFRLSPIFSRSSLIPKNASKQADRRAQETIERLWARLAKEPANREVRNRLAEHYTPLVQIAARQYAKLFHVVDVENAVGDAVLHLLEAIIPQYDGRRSFRVWARACTRRRVLDQRRRERRAREEHVRGFGCRVDDLSLDGVAICPSECESDLRFAELVARLTPREGAMLWLRYYRGASNAEIGDMFGIRTGGVKGRISEAISALRKNFRTFDDLPAY